MNFGIIAAGQGLRMRREGACTPKPLAIVGGATLLQRLLDAMIHAKAKHIAVVHNVAASDVANAISAHATATNTDIQAVAIDGGNSLNSLETAVKALPSDSPLCIATVDSVFQPARLVDFIDAFTNDIADYDCYMAVTTFIDDERPLYVTTIDDGKTIDSFTDDAPQHPHYVSAGIYAMRPTILPVLAQCIANGYSLRQFQQALVDNGLRLCAYDLGTVIDVDHVSDIATANKYVSQWQKSSTQNTIQK